MSILRTGDERHHGNSLRRISPSHRHTAQKKRKEGAKESGPLQIPHTCTLDHFKVVLFFILPFSMDSICLAGWMDGKEKPSKMRRDPFFFLDIYSNGFLHWRVIIHVCPPPPLSLSVHRRARAGQAPTSIYTWARDGENRYSAQCI